MYADLLGISENIFSYNLTENTYFFLLLKNSEEKMRNIIGSYFQR